MILLVRRAEKDLEELSPVQRKRILKKLQSLDLSPESPHVKKLATLRGEGIYRARVGVYRILFLTEGEDVVILRIVHRRDLERAIKELG